MSAFADTAGLYALLAEDERDHSSAVAAWRELLSARDRILTTNYVLIETAAVIQRRLGMAALRVFHDEIAPALDVIWIDEEQHRRGAEAALTAARRSLSVVDCISFHVMRQHHIPTAFTLDAHFREQGFAVVP